jgi:hypothetical protein
MSSLPPLEGPAWMFAMIGPIDDVMSVGCVDPSNDVTFFQSRLSPSGVTRPPKRYVTPLVRSKRSFETKPPPTSKSPPVSSQSSCASHATNGLTNSGFSASSRSFGITVSVRREPAMGAIVLTRIPRFFPSSASVLEKPTSPSFAAL